MKSIPEISEHCKLIVNVAKPLKKCLLKKIMDDLSEPYSELILHADVSQVMVILLKVPEKCSKKLMNTIPQMVL